MTDGSDLVRYISQALARGDFPTDEDVVRWFEHRALLLRAAMLSREPGGQLSGSDAKSLWRDFQAIYWSLVAQRRDRIPFLRLIEPYKWHVYACLPESGRPSADLGYVADEAHATQIVETAVVLQGASIVPAVVGGLDSSRGWLLAQEQPERFARLFQSIRSKLARAMQTHTLRYTMSFTGPELDVLEFIFGHYDPTVFSRSAGEGSVNLVLFLANCTLATATQPAGALIGSEVSDSGETESEGVRVASSHLTSHERRAECFAELRSTLAPACASVGT